MNLCATHLNCLFDSDRFEIALSMMKQTLKAVDKEYNGFVVRGVSGMGFGFILARELGKKVVVVRKNEKTHSHWNVENLGYNDNLVWIDDFVESGETGRSVDTAITRSNNLYDQGCTIVGALMYDAPDDLRWGRAEFKHLIRERY